MAAGTGDGTRKKLRALSHNEPNSSLNGNSGSNKTDEGASTGRFSNPACYQMMNLK